jgi:hypothetical protein
MTGLDHVTAALQELGVASAVDPLSAEDAAYGLAKLNRLINNWNAEREAVYATVFTTGLVFTPALSPHTIGPTGTFVVTQRPVSIAGANVIVAGVKTPIRMVDSQWWLAQTVPGTTSPYPTDLYYEPTWPNGSLFFWPVPTAANGLELMIRTVLASFTLPVNVTLPPGYDDAIDLTLAEDLAGPFQVPVSPLLVSKAREARARIFANNRRPIPRLTTWDAGMPGGDRRDHFDYRSRGSI